MACDFLFPFNKENIINNRCSKCVSFSLFVCLKFLILGCASMSVCDNLVKLQAEDLDVKLFQDSSNYPNYYRYLTVDRSSNFLFVGAMNRIYGLNLKNIENTSQRLKQEFRPASTKVFICQNSGKKASPDCQNHIRVLFRNSSVPNTFYMCGTGALSPVAYQLKLEGDKFRVMQEDLDGVGICPYDYNDNTTVVFVEHGAPGNIPVLFSGAFVDSIKADPVIARPFIYDSAGRLAAEYVRTIRGKHDWLNEPQFVGSFDVGNYVYFFYREVALEYKNCGKKIFSRVARVCKNDVGGEGTLRNIWISFIKSRLNCSIPGEYPYYFDEIQDVYMVGDVFYALFTTNVNGLTASAICGYSIQDIDRNLQGAFKGQRDDYSMWLPIPEEKIPTPRPGYCYSAGNRTMPASQFHRIGSFISRSSMLMDKAIRHKFGRPIFYKTNCMMQKLVAASGVAGHDELVFFTASNTGVIYKIASWTQMNAFRAPETRIVAEYIPFNDNRSIWSLKLHDSWIYVGTDMAVGQISVVTCDKYKKIDLCIYDPYCGWDKNYHECKSYKPNLINFSKIDLLSYSLEEAIRKEVGSLYFPSKVSKFTGNSVTFKVDYQLHIAGGVVWTKNGSSAQGERHILAQDNSLIVTDIRKSDEGLYIAKDKKGRTVAEHLLIVETNKEQIEQRWMRKFDQWCDEFERYQQDIRHWEKKCESCCQESAAVNSMFPALGEK